MTEEIFFLIFIGCAGIFLTWAAISKPKPQPKPIKKKRSNLRIVK